MTSLADHLPACLVEVGSAPGVEPFLRRFLHIFEALAAPVDERVAGLEHLVDPGVAPLSMAKWMATWVGVEVIDTQLPERRLRDLVRGGGRPMLLRGTATGVMTVLELATGGGVEVLDSGGVEVLSDTRASDAPSGSSKRHVTVNLESTGALTDGQLLDVLRRELPMGVTFDLQVGTRRVQGTAFSR